MSGLYTCPVEMADNKLREAGSESIERDRPDIYSDERLPRQEREEPAGQHGRTDRRGGPVGHELREADPIRTMTGMMGLC